MTQMNTMNTQFTALTEEELMNVEGGIGWQIAVGVAVGAGIVYVVGAAMGYYANRP